eukprot:SAG31_NODE_2_length_46263_cov_45.908043_2_plen_58_part_00
MKSSLAIFKIYLEVLVHVNLVSKGIVPVDRLFIDCTIQLIRVPRYVLVRPLSEISYK